MSKDDIIKDLESLVATQGIVVYDMIEQKCVEYLKASGYRVVKRVESTYKNVKNTNDLVGLFYSLVDYHYPSPVGYYRNIGKDRKLAKSMIDNRMKATNISKEEALAECALLVESLFKYVDEFNFDNNPTSFGIFGHEKMGWITDKLGRLLLDKEKQRLKIKRDDMEQEILNKTLEERGIEYLRLEGI